MIPLYLAYAVFGFTFSFISISVQFTMVDKYGFEPAENAYAWALISLPWVFKPLYAVAADHHLFVYRRFQISIGGFLSAMSFALSPSAMTDKSSFVAILTMSSLFLCVSDVACDSLMVQLSKHNTDIQSNCFLARNLGKFIATGLSGVAYRLGIDIVLMCTSIPIFTMSLYIWNLPEQVKAPNNVSNILWTSVLAIKKMWRLMLFILVSSVVPEINSVLFYKLKASGITPIQFSVVGLVGSACSCIVAYVYQYWRGFKCTIMVGLCISIAGGLCAIAISNGCDPYIYAIARSMCNACASTLITLPIIYYVSKHCPVGSEGTTYSFVMAWLNLTSVVSETIEGSIVQYIGITDNDLSLLTTFCTVGSVLTVVPILYTHFILQKVQL